MCVLQRSSLSSETWSLNWRKTLTLWWSWRERRESWLRLRLRYTFIPGVLRLIGYTAARQSESRVLTLTYSAESLNQQETICSVCECENSWFLEFLNRTQISDSLIKSHLYVIPLVNVCVCSWVWLRSVSMARPPVSHREFGFRLNRRGNRAAVSIYTHTAVLRFTPVCILTRSPPLSVSKALQEFDLALRGKKKREKFVKDGRKKELTVLIFITTKLINKIINWPPESEGA